MKPAPIRVLSVASEAFPLVKTGGLGDVAGALPAALAPQGVELTTLLPGYPAVLAAAGKRVLHRWDDLLGAHARLLSGTLGGQPLLILDVWEHAYYIDYRNARPTYAEAILRKAIDWDFVAKNLDGKGASRADQKG